MSGKGAPKARAMLEARKRVETALELEDKTLWLEKIEELSSDIEKMVDDWDRSLAMVFERMTQHPYFSHLDLFRQFWCHTQVFRMHSISNAELINRQNEGVPQEEIDPSVWRHMTESYDHAIQSLNQSNKNDQEKMAMKRKTSTVLFEFYDQVHLFREEKSFKAWLLKKSKESVEALQHDGCFLRDQVYKLVQKFSPHIAHTQTELSDKDFPFILQAYQLLDPKNRFGLGQHIIEYMFAKKMNMKENLPKDFFALRSEEDHHATLMRYLDMVLLNKDLSLLDRLDISHLKLEEQLPKDDVWMQILSYFQNPSLDTSTMEPWSVAWVDMAKQIRSGANRQDSVRAFLDQHLEQMDPSCWYILLDHFILDYMDSEDSKNYLLVLLSEPRYQDSIVGHVQNHPYPFPCCISHLIVNKYAKEFLSKENFKVLIKRIFLTDAVMNALFTKQAFLPFKSFFISFYENILVELGINDQGYQLFFAYHTLLNGSTLGDISEEHDREWCDLTQDFLRKWLIQKSVMTDPKEAPKKKKGAGKRKKIVSKKKKTTSKKVDDGFYPWKTLTSIIKILIEKKVTFEAHHLLSLIQQYGSNPQNLQEISSTDVDAILQCLELCLIISLKQVLEKTKDIGDKQKSKDRKRNKQKRNELIPICIGAYHLYFELLKKTSPSYQMRGAAFDKFLQFFSAQQSLLPKKERLLGLRQLFEQAKEQMRIRTESTEEARGKQNVSLAPPKMQSHEEKNEPLPPALAKVVPTPEQSVEGGAGKDDEPSMASPSRKQVTVVLKENPVERKRVDAPTLHKAMDEMVQLMSMCQRLPVEDVLEMPFDLTVIKNVIQKVEGSEEKKALKGRLEMLQSWVDARDTWVGQTWKGTVLGPIAPLQVQSTRAVEHHKPVTSINEYVSELKGLVQKILTLTLSDAQLLRGGDWIQIEIGKTNDPLLIGIQSHLHDMWMSNLKQVFNERAHMLHGWTSLLVNQLYMWAPTNPLTPWRPFTMPEGCLIKCDQAIKALVDQISFRDLMKKVQVGQDSYYGLLKKLNTMMQDEQARLFAVLRSTFPGAKDYKPLHTFMTHLPKIQSLQGEQDGLEGGADVLLSPQKIRAKMKDMNDAFKVYLNDAPHRGKTAPLPSDQRAELEAVIADLEKKGDLKAAKILRQHLESGKVLAFSVAESKPSDPKELGEDASSEEIQNALAYFTADAENYNATLLGKLKALGNKVKISERNAECRLQYHQLLYAVILSMVSKEGDVSREHHRWPFFWTNIMVSFQSIKTILLTEDVEGKHQKLKELYGLLIVFSDVSQYFNEDYRNWFLDEMKEIPYLFPDEKEDMRRKQAIYVAKTLAKAPNADQPFLFDLLYHHIDPSNHYELLGRAIGTLEDRGEDLKEKYPKYFNDPKNYFEMIKALWLYCRGHKTWNKTTFDEAYLRKISERLGEGHYGVEVLKAMIDPSYAPRYTWIRPSIDVIKLKGHDAFRGALETFSQKHLEDIPCRLRMALFEMMALLVTEDAKSTSWIIGLLKKHKAVLIKDGEKEALLFLNILYTLSDAESIKQSKDKSKHDADAQFLRELMLSGHWIDVFFKNPQNRRNHAMFLEYFYKCLEQLGLNDTSIPLYGLEVKKYWQEMVIFYYMKRYIATMDVNPVELEENAVRSFHAWVSRKNASINDEGQYDWKMLTDILTQLRQLDKVSWEHFDDAKTLLKVLHRHLNAQRASLENQANEILMAVDVCIQFALDETKTVMDCAREEEDKSNAKGDIQEGNDLLQEGARQVNQKLQVCLKFLKEIYPVLMTHGDGCSLRLMEIIDHISQLAKDDMIFLPVRADALEQLMVLTAMTMRIEQTLDLETLRQQSLNISALTALANTTSIPHETGQEKQALRTFDKRKEGMGYSEKVRQFLARIVSSKRVIEERSKMPRLTLGPISPLPWPPKRSNFEKPVQTIGAYLSSVQRLVGEMLSMRKYEGSSDAELEWMNVPCAKNTRDEVLSQILHTHAEAGGAKDVTSSQASAEKNQDPTSHESSLHQKWMDKLKDIARIRIEMMHGLCTSFLNRLQRWMKQGYVPKWVWCNQKDLKMLMGNLSTAKRPKIKAQEVRDIVSRVHKDLQREQARLWHKMAEDAEIRLEGCPDRSNLVVFIHQQSKNLSL